MVISLQGMEKLLFSGWAIFMVVFGSLGMVGPGFCQGITRSQGVLEVSFEYVRQRTIASNQFALWIEDAEGNLVKTIYVTRFTGRGGYTRRPDCLPTWVKKANPSSWPAALVDTIATATPPGGLLVYTWDGHDEAGNLVAPGEYRFFLEANLYWANRVLYSASFHYGGESQEEIPLSVTYSGDDARREMIRNLRVRYVASE